MNSLRYRELVGHLLEGELSDAATRELAAGLTEHPELRRDMRSHLVLWELWSQEHSPERSADAFLNALKTRIRVENEGADAFADSSRNRIGAPRPRTGILEFLTRFFAGPNRPKGIACAGLLVIGISVALWWFGGARSAQGITALAGEAVCTACVLNETQDHAPALRVLIGSATNIYYLDRTPAVATLQGYFCSGPTPATVEGHARTEAGKRFIQVERIAIPEPNRSNEPSADAAAATLAE